MLIIFGTKVIKSDINSEKPLLNSCPSCGGNLYPKKYSKWFTLFFIPIFSVKDLGNFYECDKCKNVYDLKNRYLQI